jgi:hypothetical protein
MISPAVVFGIASAEVQAEVRVLVRVPRQSTSCRVMRLDEHEFSDLALHARPPEEPTSLQSFRTHDLTIARAGHWTCQNPPGGQMDLGAAMQQCSNAP